MKSSRDQSGDSITRLEAALLCLERKPNVAAFWAEAIESMPEADDDELVYAAIDVEAAKGTGSVAVALLNDIHAAADEGFIDDGGEGVNRVDLARWVHALGIRPFPPLLSEFAPKSDQLLATCADMVRNGRAKRLVMDYYINEVAKKEGGRRISPNHFNTKVWPAITSITPASPGRPRNQDALNIASIERGESLL